MQGTNHYQKASIDLPVTVKKWRFLKMTGAYSPELFKQNCFEDFPPLH